MIWGTVIIFGTANSVNLTDGLDGLAAGSAAFVCGFLALVGFVQWRHPGIYARAQRPRPRPGGDGDGRCLCRLSVVERRSGEDNHG